MHIINGSTYRPIALKK